MSLRRESGFLLFLLLPFFPFPSPGTGRRSNRVEFPTSPCLPRPFFPAFPREGARPKPNSPSIPDATAGTTKGELVQRGTVHPVAAPHGTTDLPLYFFSRLAPFRPATTSHVQDPRLPYSFSTTLSTTLSTLSITRGPVAAWETGGARGSPMLSCVLVLGWSRCWCRSLMPVLYKYSSSVALSGARGRWAPGVLPRNTLGGDGRGDRASFVSLSVCVPITMGMQAALCR
jgi:hypothetical protein